SVRRGLDVQDPPVEPGRVGRVTRRRRLQHQGRLGETLAAMPFIPHTENDIKVMLAAIGVDGIDALFEEIPARLRSGKLTRVPEGLSEMQVARLMRQRAAEGGFYLNFIGAGAHEHHIPAAVWEIATRGEFYSAHTAYQAGAS